MATFETHFVEDRAAQKETKNPYFELINDADFCKKILREFGVADTGLIVNGHVRVEIAEGDQPMKRGRNAVTIDGAFPKAYGDHGCTLISDPERIAIAEQYHFASLEEAIPPGADIIPKVGTRRTCRPGRLVADTGQGEIMRSTISMLEGLIHGYEEGLVVEN